MQNSVTDSSQETQSFSDFKDDINGSFHFVSQSKPETRRGSHLFASCHLDNSGVHLLVPIDISIIIIADTRCISSPIHFFQRDSVRV